MINKGDIVGRISYGKDILFIVDRIINLKSNRQIAILKGIVKRIVADAPVEDLQKIDKSSVKKVAEKMEEELNNRIALYREVRTSKKSYTGRILHLDGDKRYAGYAFKYYKKLGLNAIVKNISEQSQPKVVRMLLEKYKPDILIVTGHDAMLKRNKNFNNIYNYRNSRYFAETVKEARKWAKSSDKLTIFARCLPEFF